VNVVQFQRRKGLRRIPWNDLNSASAKGLGGLRSAIARWGSTVRCRRYTIDHTSRSDAEATTQMLGVRLFNAAASGLKLALSGYHQTAFNQARDIMETGFLLDYFRTSPDKIQVWKTTDRLRGASCLTRCKYERCWTSGTAIPK
jgi:hypothetical protein